jgi:hypothetical protein
MSKPSGTKALEKLSTSLRVSPHPQPLYAELSAQSAQEFGRGLEAKELDRMLQLAVTFPNKEKVASLMRQLTGVQIVATPSRQFRKSNKLRQGVILSLQIVSTLSTQLMRPFLT